MRKNSVLILLALFLFIYTCTETSAQNSSPSSSVPAADAAAIKQTALDYIEGWYEGNAERMERALHPELAKRIVETHPQTGRSRLNQMSALSLVQGTRMGGGTKTPKDKQQKDVTILDVYEGAASVKVVAGAWIDYLHMARFNGRWVIVNVLWELKPEKK
ncbi:MAG TPA: nuclear transport factor 2 family protein [Pyrinomonadaceae bacterium]